MNNIFKKLTIALYFFALNVTAQVTVRSTQISINNGNPVYGCTLLDFGSIQSNTLRISYKLTKPTNQVVGTGSLKVIFKYTPADVGYMIGTAKTISTGDWISNTQAIGEISVTIQANLIQTTGSSIVLEYTSSSNVANREDCEYSLKKDLVPTFALSPTSISIGCGDTNPRTFSVTASNIPANANVYYNWFAPGWSGLNGATGNTVILSPASATILPSTVNVVPYLNGVAQNTISCAVNRAAFTSSARIIGPPALCSTATYTLGPLPSNVIVTNWDIQNANNVTMSATSGPTTTLTMNGSGTIQLIATIANQCGQTLVLPTVTIFVGRLPSPLSLIGPTTVRTGALARYQASVVPGATSYEWFLPYPYDTVPVFDYFGQNWAKTELGSSERSISVFTGYAGTPGLIQVVAVNACGSGGARMLSVTHGVGGGGAIPRLSQPQKIFDTQIFPNPTSDVLQINLKSDFSNKKIVATLYDMLGRQLLEIDVLNSKALLNVEDLPSGNYILKLKSNIDVESHQITIK